MTLAKNILIALACVLIVLGPYYFIWTNGYNRGLRAQAPCIEEHEVFLDDGIIFPGKDAADIPRCSDAEESPCFDFLDPVGPIE